MSSLPILARELRVRARKPWTAWTRVIVALLATLMTVSTLAWAQHATWTTTLPGKTVFDTLTGLLFAFCLVEGVRLTADCLSGEKREGTLGLLFLTELRGFDVVLGKLVATSLVSFFGLMAVFPVMAVALTAGGLTGGEFWRTVLVLLNTLFVALACGIWVSARQNEEGRALLTALGWVLGVTFLPWIAEPILRLLAWPNVSLSVALRLADDTLYRASAGRFWGTMAAAHGLAWLWLLAAGRRIESTWREEPSSVIATPPAGQDQKPDTSMPSETDGQERIPSAKEDPAFWLARRTWRHRRLIWVMMGVMALGPFSVVLLMFLPGLAAFNGLYSALHYGFGILPLVLLLFAASRPFAEARRCGMMELLLTTPLTPGEIVACYWRALWRGLPGLAIVTAVGILLLALVPLVIIQAGQMLPFYLLQALQSLEDIVAGLAGCWLGLYLGLRTESAFRATGYGVLWMIVVPTAGTWLFWWGLQFFVPAVFTGPIPVLVWFAQTVPMLIGIAYAIGVALWSRRQLLSRFRELAAPKG